MLVTGIAWAFQGQKLDPAALCGLGLIVALYRRRLPIDVDELRELQG